MTNSQDGQQPLTSKYYTPDIEDLFYGYKYEVLERENEWLPQTFGEHYEPYDDIRDNKIRTKFLDKEDIESLGCIGFKEMNSAWRSPLDKRPVMYYAEKNNAMMSFDFVNHIIGIVPKDPTKSIDGTIDEFDYPPKVGMFRGECKSINELKTIMKWLHIDTEITK